MTELGNIITLLTNTFGNDPWYGPSVKEVLQNVGSTVALKRFPNTHSIIELVNHMTAWRTYVIKKITTDPDYQMNEALNFPQSEDWKKAVDSLFESQQNLLDALHKFDPSRLYDSVPATTHPYNYYTLFHGIIHHDIYHIGQISLIAKSTQGKSI